MQFRCVFFAIIATLNFLPASFAQDPIVLEHGGAVQAVEFSPVNASLFASAGGDNTIKLWNLEDDTVTTFRGHAGQINAVAFSPNGQLLASGGDDWTFKLWNIPQQQHIATLEHITNRNRSQVKGVAFSPDGQLLASAGHLGVKLWDVNNQTEIANLHHDGWVFTSAFSPNGKTLATGDNAGTVRIWDVQTRQVIAQLEGDTVTVYAVKFSSDGRTFATAGYHGTIKIWSVSDWGLLGTLENRGTVHTLDFSPDGKALASTGHSVVTLWSVESGTEIASLTGHSDWVRGVAFAPNGNTVVSGGDDGTVRLQNTESYLQTLQQREMVRIIYFLPRNRPPQSNINTKLDTLIKDTQAFYADQMQNRGFGRKTFTFETGTTGKAAVYRMNGKFTDRYYHTETISKIMEEVNEEFDISKNIYLIVADVSNEVIEGENTCGIGGGSWEGIEAGMQRRDLGGHAIIPASGMCFSINVTAHELGHTFGLEHDFRSDTYLMSYGAISDQLSHCATEWLNVHRYFNASQTSFNEPTTIEMLTPFALPPNVIRFRFEVTDADGPHQAQLLIPTAIRDLATGSKLHRCKSLNGESQRIEFTTTELKSGTATQVVLQVIDVHGNITRQTYPLGANDIANVDVNNDGNIDITDLVLVASHFHTAAVRGAKPNPDVNKDGFVDREDLLLVVDALESEENISAAPALATENLQHWIFAAKQYDLGDPTFQRGIAVLEQLLMPSHPTETALLPNYPNPFNPETWIPYHLAKSTDVSISIYAADGKLVRSLHLGYQAVGTYESRSRAAYWDGRNEFGEPVASGIYFYTLSAGNFVATRKMLIRK